MIAGSSLDEVRRKKQALARAVSEKNSVGYTLSLWSNFIRSRDGDRCVSCGAIEQLQAHHLFRRTLLPHAQFELGNGITLCRDCHQRLHSIFNGKPDLTRPLDAQGGDNQEDIAALYAMMLKDANRRGLDHDEFYYLSDQMLWFFVRVQGLAHWYLLVQDGYMTRLRMAKEIWRDAPEAVSTALLTANGFDEEALANRLMFTGFGDPLRMKLWAE
jgi:5-methylcytosine-specific restriction endonuclease McrA